MISVISMNTKRAMTQILKYLASAGVSHIPRVNLSRQPKSVAEPGDKKTTPVRSGRSSGPDVVSESRKTESRPVVKEMKRPPAGLLLPEELQPGTGGRPALLPEVQLILERSFSETREKVDALCALAKTVAACKRCSELASRRTQTVFGVGNPNARIMFIGEAPGADEDAQGEPFVGPAGQLLNKIITASQLRREDLYICNILRCRPPGNRNPLPQEAANCREFLDAQIHVVQPQYILCWGTVAAQNLLNVAQPVGRLRGQFFDYRGIRVLCTYHPSYLLRNPSAKKQVWEDMKLFMKEMGVTLQ